jgi:hypothetical protein
LIETSNALSRLETRLSDAPQVDAWETTNLFQLAQTILRAINAYFKNLSEKKINEAQPNQVYFVLYDPESVSIYTSELSKLDINA